MFSEWDQHSRVPVGVKVENDAEWLESEKLQFEKELSDEEIDYLDSFPQQDSTYQVISDSMAAMSGELEIYIYLY